MKLILKIPKVVQNIFEHIDQVSLHLTVHYVVKSAETLTNEKGFHTHQ